jgi:hypothetical protein
MSEAEISLILNALDSHLMQEPDKAEQIETMSVSLEERIQW